MLHVHTETNLTNRNRNKFEFLQVSILQYTADNVMYMLDLTFTGPHHRPIFFIYFALRPICNPLTKKKANGV